MERAFSIPNLSVVRRAGRVWQFGTIACLLWAAARAIAQVDNTPPTVPTGLIATPVSPVHINLSWTASADSGGIGGYQIYRGGNLIASTTGTGTAYNDLSLAPNTTYAYAVAAYDASSSHNTSARSTTINATTQNPNYSNWPKGPSPTNDPNFFPIGVWLQSLPNLAAFKSIGINLFVGFWGDLTQSALTEQAASQMPIVLEQNQVGLIGSGNAIIKGWGQIDEPDNAQPNGSGGYGPCIPPSQVIASYNTIKANDATRPVMLNFGRGVSHITYGGRGVCSGDTNYYIQASAAGDILSFDIYPISDYNGKLEMIPNGVDNLKNWSGNTKIIWSFIEGSSIHGGAVPTGDQVKAEVWMCLIHGSRGIVYFVHQFQPAFREDGIFNYPALAAAVSNINAQVTSLAPVLNSPTIANAVQVNSSVVTVPVDVMVKKQNGSMYVFSVAMRGTPTTATFTIPGLQSATAAVLGENRQLTVTNGVFQDSFNGYGVHLYQISAPRPGAPSNLQIAPGN